MMKGTRGAARRPRAAFKQRAARAILPACGTTRGDSTAFRSIPSISTGEPAVNGDSKWNGITSARLTT
jgi:hypothetical protein